MKKLLPRKRPLLKSLALLGLLSAVFVSVFEYPNIRIAWTNLSAKEIAPTAGITTAYPGLTPLEMMSSTVRIHVTIEYTKLADKKQPKEQHEKNSWAGSGVVYDKTDRSKGPVRSRILSANHVLQTPAVGSVEDETIEIFGMKMKLGKRRVDAVKFELQTADGRICNLKPLALASTDQHDTATAEADCDAGRVAKLATAMPVMGERVFVAGYSEGVKLPMLTDGFVSGWMDGYLLTSAPAYGGNSGGPVYHNGKVVGLLVRASREYPHLTLTASLEECLRRIAETPPLN
jgi:S1-C subfamily serine protease